MTTSPLNIDKSVSITCLQILPDGSKIKSFEMTLPLFFSYFQVDQKYYLFIYAEKITEIDIDFFYQKFNVLEEVDTKKRKIQSLRGFFLYALEIIETGQNFEVLETNFKPYFWRKIKNIIRQNKKEVLLKFLFETSSSVQSNLNQINLEEIIVCFMSVLAPIVYSSLVSTGS